MESTSTLIVAGERSTHSRLQNLLRQDSEINLVGLCDSEHEAVALIQRCKPELVFLDVKSNQIDGLGIVERFDDEKLPVFIYVSDDPEYALRAFDFRVRDYLLNPFSDERFKRALGRAKATIHQQKLIEHCGQLMLLLQNKPASLRPRDDIRPSEEPKIPVDRLVLKAGSRFLLLSTDEIDWIEASDVYVRLHTSGRSHLMRTRIKSVEKQLDAKQFIRIHRSTIVNLRRVREIVPHYNGGAIVSLRDGTKLKMSRSYLHKLTSILS